MRKKKALAKVKGARREKKGLEEKEKSKSHAQSAADDETAILNRIAQQPSKRKVFIQPFDQQYAFCFVACTL